MAATNKPAAISALHSIAQTLPGLAGLTLSATPTQAANNNTEATQASLRHYQYGEDGDSSRSTSDDERFDVTVNQFQIQGPLNEGRTLQGAFFYQRETMSGATPWYTLQQGEEVVQVMSGASEERQEWGSELNYKRQRDALGLSLSHAEENDYRADQLGVTYEKDIQHHNGSPAAASWSTDLYFGKDRIDAVGADRPKDQTKDTASWFITYSLDVNRWSRIQFSYGFQRRDGYLADPYKLVFLQADLIDDTRPNQRDSHTLSAKYRRYLPFADAALHGDYQYYRDDWEVVAHSLDLAWHQNLGQGWQVIPSLRLYAQSDAFFYQPVYGSTRSDGFYSTDYRLSSYGSVTLGLRAQTVWDHWRFSLAWDQYRSLGDWGLDNDEVNNPGLLDFSVASLGLDYTF